MTGPAAVLTPGASAQLDDYPIDLAWSADGRHLLVAGGEGRLHRVESANAAVLLLGVQEPGLLSAVWQPGGRLVATAGQDGTVRIWEAMADAASSGRVVHRGRHWPMGLAFEPRGKAVAFASGREVRVIGADGAVMHSLEGHDCNLTHLAWRNTGELLVAGNGALFIDRLEPEPSIIRHGLDGAPLTLAISPDGRIAATGMQDGTVMFRILTAQKKSRMSGYDGKVIQTAWSANSRYLATAASGNNVIIVWDFGGKGPEGSDPLQLQSHSDRIESLAFQPAGPYLASGSRDWRVVLWRPGPAGRGAAAVTPIDVQLLDGPVSLLRWSRDGRQLAVAQASGRVQFFGLKA